MDARKERRAARVLLHMGDDLEDFDYDRKMRRRSGVSGIAGEYNAKHIGKGKGKKWKPDEDYHIGHDGI